jgi:hypothetical protein
MEYATPYQATHSDTGTATLGGELADALAMTQLRIGCSQAQGAVKKKGTKGTRTADRAAIREVPVC